MALNMKVSNGSDDEEDLEFLRLAALQSLKKTGSAQPVVQQKQQKPSFGAAQPTRHHRGFRGGNRAGRNGFGRGRASVNSNLISIRTVDEEQEQDVKENSEDVPKLILPQDRYHNVGEKLVDKEEGASNKFDRYDNSDKSDSDSDEDENEDRHEREDSLERLIDLLDDEINERNEKDKAKEKKNEKVKSAKKNTEDSKNLEVLKSTDDTKSAATKKIAVTNKNIAIDKSAPITKSVAIDKSEPAEISAINDKSSATTKSVAANKSTGTDKNAVPYKTSVVDKSAKVEIETKVENDSVLIIETENELGQDDLPEETVEKSKPTVPMRSKSRERSPFFRRSPGRFESGRRSRSPLRRRVYKSRTPERDFRHNSRSPPRKKPYLDYPPSPRNDPYQSRLRSPPRNYPPDLYRPLSPLHIDQSVFSLASAPLSPRSAAFVLKNREILARRKMSPRKSLSPSPRRSLSPRRSFSPRRRSRSPRFDYKKSRSPRSRSPRIMSPKRRSLSPKRFRRSPDRLRRSSRSPVNKIPVHKRLDNIGEKISTRTVQNRFELGNPQTSPPRDKKPDLVPRRNKHRSMSLSLSPSPDRNYNRQPLNKTTGLVKDRQERNPDRQVQTCNKRVPTPENQKPIERIDPVLEARRRKFENPVQIEPGKTIKLNVNKKEKDPTDTKQNDEDNDENIEENYEEDFNQFEENFNPEEEEIDDLIELNPTADDLWSEEESENENEGRFKTENNQKRTVTCLPFSKLTERQNPKPLFTTNEQQRSDRFDRRRLKENRNKDSFRTKSDSYRDKSEHVRHKNPDSFSSSKPKRLELKTRSEKPKPLPKLYEVPKKSKVNVYSDKSNDILISDKVIEKEDKIEEKLPVKEVVRKVEIPKKEVKEVVKEVKEDDLDLDDDDTEIIIEFDDEEDEEFEKPVKGKKSTNEKTVKENKAVKEIKDDEGDLRAELSRKRAQRLHKPQPTDSVQARLLSTALKEVGVKRKSSKTEKSSVLVSGTITDRKVLLVKSSSDTVQPTDIKKKKDLIEGTTKLPIHMRLGLNAGKEIELDDIDDDDELLMERRKKKRRKPIQV